MPAAPPRDMIVRRSAKIDGVAHFDGCANPFQIRKFSTRRETCFFSMSDVEKMRFTAHVLKVFPGGGLGFKEASGGCRLDCTPFAQATVGSAKDSEVSESWISTADDGSGMKQLNYKVEHTNLDDRGAPVNSRTPESGCPWFRPDVTPTGNGPLIHRIGGRS